MKLALLAFAALAATAQINSLTKEQLLQYTKQNPFERFPDGRPKVPDALLEKLRAMSSEEILSIIRKGYPNQYVDGFQIVKLTVRPTRNQRRESGITQNPALGTATQQRLQSQQGRQLHDRVTCRDAPGPKRS